MPKHSRPALDVGRAPDVVVPRLLTEAQVLGLVPISRVTLWRWEAAGEFPKRVRLGEARVGWPENEVSAWIRSRWRREPSSRILPPSKRAAVPSGAVGSFTFTGWQASAAGFETNDRLGSSPSPLPL
jgi:prophage regulatory protein